MILHSVLLTLSTLVVVSALDVEISDFTCDNSYPMTTTLEMSCNGTSRCTFGETAIISGFLTYSGVDQTGIQNNQAYVSSELAFPTMNFNILNMMKLPLCDESLVADSGNTNECPGDGTFSYSVYYNLPKSGTESASWMASGWTGTGYIEIYAEANVNMMIGRCSMDLQTYVTASEEKGYLRTPSAATAAGISLAALAALSLLCFWCCCCMGRRKSKTSHEGEETTSFTRMNDEIPYSVNAADKKSGLKKALVE